DDPAGDGETAQHPFPVAEVDRLFPHPGDEEDVVVDAQSHQEREGEQRHPGVGARQVQQVVEDERAHPRAEPNDTTVVMMRSTGATSDRSSTISTSSTTASTSGTTT